MAKKILPLCEKQVLVSSVDYAHILSIILTDPKAYEWIAENYIQILINKESLNTEPMFYNFNNYNEFYNTEYYFVAKNKNCPFLDIYRHCYTEYKEYKISILQYLKMKISLGFYIFMYFDITKITAYKLNIKIHCPLIFGFDDVKKVFYFRDYCDLHYGTHSVSYSELEEGFNSFMSKTEIYKEIEEYGINCIKKVYCDYRINIKQLKSVLKDYLEGDGIKTYYIKFIQNNNYHFGIDVIRLTITALMRSVLFNDPEIGWRVRYSHFIDHKMAMKIRLEVLYNLGFISDKDFNELHSAVQDALKITYTVQNYYLKYQIDKKIKNIRNIIDLLIQLEKMDIKYIGKLLEIL